MSGGVAYVYDEDGQFASRCNTAMVSLDRVALTSEQHLHDASDWHGEDSDEQHLLRLLQEHNRWTGSKRARELLDAWPASRLKFVKVFPTEYKKALVERRQRRVAALAPSAHAIPHGLVSIAAA